jgi:hypothetical protein
MPFEPVHIFPFFIRVCLPRSKRVFVIIVANFKGFESMKVFQHIIVKRCLECGGFYFSWQFQRLHYGHFCLICCPFAVYAAGKSRGLFSAYTPLFPQVRDTGAKSLPAGDVAGNMDYGLSKTSLCCKGSKEKLNWASNLFQIMI